MSKTSTKQPWYVEERARALAVVCLTRRDDLALSQADKDHGVDYLVRIASDRRGLRRFGVVVRGAERVTRPQQADRALRPILRRLHAGGTFPFPVALVCFSVDNDSGYLTWVAEPVADRDRPLLRKQEEPSCRPLTPEALDEVVGRVSAWYDALGTGAPPDSEGNGAGNGLNVLHGILDAESRYAAKHGEEPTLLKLPAPLAYDLAKLGREHLGDLSAKIVKHGIKALEDEGLFGMRVQIVRNSSKEIAVE